MRGLLKAALLLAPALASAFTVPHFWPEHSGEHLDSHDEQHEGGSRTIHLKATGSPDVEILTFHVNVLPSSQMCGVGNVTVNGQPLGQESRGDGSSGKGTITDVKNIISASWEFDCLRGLRDVPSAQFMKFTIDSVDGKDVEDLAFSILFRQALNTGIIMTSPDLPLDSPVAKDQSFLDLSADEEDEEVEFDIQEEKAEVEWMKNLVKELEYRIAIKEETISVYAANEMVDSMDDCDSLTCLIKAAAARARKLAHKVKHNVSKHLSGYGHGPKHHFKHPHWKKPGFPFKHGNHSHHNKTCHRPQHNHTHPHPHLPPRWHKPHFRLPPQFCHGPPPPRHGPPHHKPPHHGGAEDGPRGPPQDDVLPQGAPHDDQSMGDHEGSGRPQPPHHGRPGNHPLKSFEDDSHEIPLHSQGRDRKKEGHGEPPYRGLDGKHRRPGWLRALHVLKFVIIGVLLSMLVAALSRRCCSSARRQARQAKREERCRRRAYRKAARKQAWKAWIKQHFRAHFATKEYEEKYGSISGPQENEDDVGSEIAQLQSAANMVSDIVAAEEGRAERVSMESRTTSLPDYRSELGEELPAYQDSDGSEESSMIADGFRYTPGSIDYTPGSSPGASEVGSVRDIIGDAKD